MNIRQRNANEMQSSTKMSKLSHITSATETHLTEK